MERNPLIVIGVPLDGEGDENTVFENWRQAVDMNIGNVIIDGDADPTITNKAASAGAYVYVGGLDPDNGLSNYRTESGVERVAATVNRFDRFYNHDIVINIYAKLPPFASDVVKALLYPLADLGVDVATLVTPITEAEARSSEIVKVELDWIERRRVHVLSNSRVGQVTNFTRDFSARGSGHYYKHVPVYAYRRSSLDRFVRFGPTVREMDERLEPERALANGMRVDAVMAEPKMVGQQMQE